MTEAIPIQACKGNHLEIQQNWLILDMNNIEKGALLIAEPFLKDVNFQRSVVLLCEHQSAGSFGITINKETEDTIGEYIEELAYCKMTVFDGGPVSRDHVHFLHQHPESIPGGQHIANGIFWGGDFKSMVDFMNSRRQESIRVRFFLGYAGWGSDQLETEMKEKSWLIAPASSKLVFHTNTASIWKESVKMLGDAFLPIINYPLDPSFN
jgi:putative transcriptional regulator